MPTKPLKSCAQPGCSERVVRGYCDEHAQPLREQHQRFKQASDYNRQRYRRERARFLLGKLCVDCRANGRVEAATELDHVIPHRGDAHLFWHRANWAGRCKRHHSMKTWREVLDPHYVDKRNGKLLRGLDITAARDPKHRRAVKFLTPQVTGDGA